MNCVDAELDELKPIFGSYDLSYRGDVLEQMLPVMLGRTTRRCAPILEMGEQLKIAP